MEILLLQNVDSIGKKNDLLVVGDGFALNYLLPRRLAIVATPTVRKRYAEHIKRRAEEKEREKEAQAGTAKALAGKAITFKKKTTKTGKLYAAITEKAIVEALKDQLSLEVDEKAVEIAEQIKATGTFEITIQMGSAKQSVNVVVEAE